MRRLGASSFALAVVVTLSLAIAARADTGAGDLAPEASALVDAWLAAQNGGDFAAYEALYAKRFTGVRRSGARAASLDRAGWMRDRQRMFRQPMKVSISDLALAATPASARVTFTQDWESGGYHDRGPKQQVVVRDDDGGGGKARIAREEMLTSTRTPSAGPIAGEEGLAFILGGYAIVQESAEASWATGPTRLDDEGDPMITSKRATHLPPELQRWVGRKLSVYAPGAGVCTATVRELRIVSLVVPHFGMRNDWRDQHRSARQRADEAWSMSEQVVGAQLDGCTSKSPAFARAAALPPLELVTPARIDKPTPAMLRALRALPSWRALQKSFVAEHGAGRWDEDAPGADIVVERWDLPTPLVTISAHASDGCAGFGGEIFAVFALRDGALTLIAEPAALRPAAALLLDGKPAFFGQPAWSDFGTALQLVPLVGEARKLAVRYLDCPC
ncbi:MAG: hypothetical protein JWM53_2959 [bacterium]|nr:hypothetical protein [bacterium]